MSGHTPGPWLYRPRPPIDDWGVIRAATPDGFIVALAKDAGASFEREDDHRRAGTDPYEANGRLIAAAPDLLKAAEWARTCVPFPSDCHAALVSAISLATEGRDAAEGEG